MTISPLARVFHWVFLYPLIFLFFSAPSIAQSNKVIGNQGQIIAAAERTFFRGNPVPTWVRPISKLSPSAGSGVLSIRLADIQAYVGDETTIYMHRAITAHEASGLGAVGQFEIEFFPEYQKVQLHSLRILRGGASIDKLHVADIRFLQRETELDRGIYSGSITAAIVTEDVRVGDTLEVEYSIVGQNPVFNGKFFYAAAWDYQVPVSLRRFILNAPEGRKIYHRLIAGDSRSPPKLDERMEGGRRILIFESRDLPPFFGESYIPSDIHAFRWLQFSEFDHWTDVNQWALELFAVKTATPRLQDALKFARAAKTQEVAVARVLEFVQNEIRYLSVSIGQNSHRPFPPEQVLERRYGDCKDKSLLMVTMLRELKIEADPVLVSTIDRKGLEKLLPSPLLFDHAIVRLVVHGKEYFLDPTRMGQYGALDRMGQVHADSKVLTIAPGTTHLSTIPASQEQIVTRKRIEHITVSALDKPVEMTVRTEMVGADAEYARVQLALMSKERLHKSFEGTLLTRYPDSVLLGEPVISDNRDQNTLSMETRYRVDKLFSASSEGWSMRYTPSNMADMFDKPDNAHREFSFALFNYPTKTIYDIDVDLPDIFDMPTGSEKKNITNNAFTVLRTLFVGGKSLRVNVTLKLNTDRVPPSEISTYLADMQKFNEILNGAFRLYKSDLKGPPSESLLKQTSVEEQLQESLKKINRVIVDAELTGRDAADALCERALANVYLGKPTEALKDAFKALQLRPQSPTMLMCRADTNLLVGKFKDAESDFTKLLARGTDTAAAYEGRAMSAFYQGKTSEAKLDFDRAVEKSEEGTERLRAMIYRGIAGEPGLSALPSSGELDPDTGWLVAAFDMLSGKTTPEHMLGLASRNAGRELDTRLVEAYFYVGKYFLLKRDKTKARVYFQRAKDKKILNSRYAILANHELMRLGQ